MAVLIEAISVVVRHDAIESRFKGGMAAFLKTIPNGTFCSDGQLARVGFMVPPDVSAWIDDLEAGGLRFVDEGKAVDLCVVDQLRGLTVPAPWLEYAKVGMGGKDQQVAACWLYEGERMGAGIHIPAAGLNLATPQDWTWEHSLSASPGFVSKEDMKENLRFLRHEDGMDVYHDNKTGKEVFVSRSGDSL